MTTRSSDITTDDRNRWHPRSVFRYPEEAEAALTRSDALTRAQVDTLAKTCAAHMVTALLRWACEHKQPRYAQVRNLRLGILAWLYVPDIVPCETERELAMWLKVSSPQVLTHHLRSLRARFGSITDPRLRKRK